MDGASVAVANSQVASTRFAIVLRRSHYRPGQSPFAHAAMGNHDHRVFGNQSPVQVVKPIAAFAAQGRKVTRR
jgi:hypothetical protein